MTEDGKVIFVNCLFFCCVAFNIKLANVQYDSVIDIVKPSYYLLMTTVIHRYWSSLKGKSVRFLSGPVSLY